MNIARMHVKNFLSISNIELKPSHITQIIGKNNQGKTSILKAIEVALKGSTDQNVVKIGETEAEIVIEFTDGLNVKRKVKSNGTQTVEVMKNEMCAKTPQTFLNSIFDGSTFNPLELLDPKRRAEAILQVVPAKLDTDTLAAALSPIPIALPPIDYSDHGLKVVAKLVDYFYARRAEANKIAGEELARMEIENKKRGEPVLASPKTDQELDQLNGDYDAQIRSIQKKKEEFSHKVDLVEELRESASSCNSEINHVEVRIQDLQNKLEKLKANHGVYSLRLKEAEEDVKVFEDLQPQAEELNNKKALVAAEKCKNANHRTWEERELQFLNQQKRHLEAQAFADKLTYCLHALRGPVKNNMMASVQMPFEGLTFKDDQFFFEGHAIENLSSSTSIRLACGIARAVAKKAKIICIDGAEALDDDSYQELKKQIENDGYNYFVTKVGEPFQDSAGDEVVRMQAGARLQ